jgi:hypothetical protein
MWWYKTGGYYVPWYFVLAIVCLFIIALLLPVGLRYFLLRRPLKHVLDADILSLVFGFIITVTLSIVVDYIAGTEIPGGWSTALIIAGAVYSYIILRKDHWVYQLKEWAEKQEEQTTKKLMIRCPKCGRKLLGATNGMTGEIGVCHKCKAEFVIKEE